jgi:hypothetical protein
MRAFLRQTSMDPCDQLAKHLLGLAPDVWKEVTSHFGFPSSDFNSAYRKELSRQIILAAKATDQLAALWTQVEERHPEGKPLPNPFLPAGET